MFPFVRSFNGMHARNFILSSPLNVSMICPIGPRWRREMKQAHKQASEENLRLKVSNYYMLLSAMCGTNTSPPICIFSFLLICRGLLFSMLTQSGLCWENGLGQQNFTVILDCCRGPALPPSPLSGASIISKQLSLQPVPRHNHNRPITGQLCVWIWAALLNSGVCQYRSLALCLSFPFCHSLSFCFSLWLIKPFLPVQPTSFNMHPLAVPKYHFKPPLPLLPQSLSASL